MNEKKVFINNENKATFVCPKCEKSITRDVTQYKDIDQAVKIKVKCKCGHKYGVLLERRQYYRKETKLSGDFQTRKGKKGKLIVLNLSRFGMKFKLRSNDALSIGDIIQVRFYLDDAHNTLIEKEVVVRTISQNGIGGEFRKIDDVSLADRRLGFYLMP